MRNFTKTMRYVYENNDGKLHYYFNKLFVDREFYTSDNEIIYLEFYKQGLLEIDEEYTNSVFTRLKISDKGGALFEFEDL